MLHIMLSSLAIFTRKFTGSGLSQSACIFPLFLFFLRCLIILSPLLTLLGILQCGTFKSLKLQLSGIRLSSNGDTPIWRRTLEWKIIIGLSSDSLSLLVGCWILRWSNFLFCRIIHVYRMWWFVNPDTFFPFYLLILTKQRVGWMNTFADFFSFWYSSVFPSIVERELAGRNPLRKSWLAPINFESKTNSWQEEIFCDIFSPHKELFLGRHATCSVHWWNSTAYCI